ncbi:MAG: HEAT repeat domain-containing protein, partial [Deltaproteobacteria bacterium]|nr:HEAT repeat domain-containing protein [Deltaproteobacteria bacterium]
HGAAPDALRRELRAALGTAARAQRSRAAFRRALELQALGTRPASVRLDLLRALGAEAAGLPEAAAAFAQLCAEDRSFRARYLLQAPAAELARGGDAGARGFLRESLARDPSPHVRAQAARASAGLAALLPELGAALGDAEPRVREAALEALATATGAAAPAATETAVVRLLHTDPWTFVRAAAAGALARRRVSAETDRALGEALADPAPAVRRATLRAIARRRSPATAEPVRRLADQPQETLDVREAAIDALGALCDAESVGLLTKLVQRTAASVLPYDRPLGLAALGALGRIHPPDLDARLAPLVDRRVEPAIRALARATLRAPGSCGR